MSAGRPRVLLTRPRTDAERTARRLDALGFDAVLAPVLDVVPLAFPVPEAGPPDAVIATSANAFLGLPSTVAEGWRALPLFAIGEATAAAARAVGFQRVTAASGDAAALAAMLMRAVPDDVLLMLLAGRPRKPELERALSCRQRDLLVVETYEARAVTWDAETIRTLHAHPPAAALHFSRRSAGLTLAAAQTAGLQPVMAGLMHVCLSEDVALALRGRTMGPIIVAGKPQADSVLQALAANLPRPDAHPDS